MAVLLAATAVVSGCGGSNDYKNELRPPAPINVAAYVSARQVSVSPARFGAGPIVVIVTNQSNSSQEVTFQTARRLSSAKNKVTQSTMINPGDTGELKLDVDQGSYEVRTGDSGIRPAAVTVGPKRASAQNDLLQP